MADIVTSRIFADGEKNITAAKLNDIVGSSVIQPAFVSAKPSTSTVAPTDNLLVLTAAGGTYAKAPFQTVIDSVNANLNTNAAIWNVRLRSFNAVGNPTFEVDQRTAFAGVTNTGWALDRWSQNRAGTMTATAVGTAGLVPVPGTNFNITQYFLRVTLTGQEASLAAGDNLLYQQIVEGPLLRELISDVSSVQLLVRSSVAGLKFGVSLRDPAGTKGLTKLATIPSANTWVLLPFPNLPSLASSGAALNMGPGNAGYLLDIALACGTTYTAPANDTWQNGNFFGAVGQDNFASKPVNSTFDIAYVCHEPGSVCSSPPMDCPFTQNYDACLRYYQKTYSYNVLPGTVTAIGLRGFVSPVASVPSYGTVSFHKPIAKVPTMTFFNHATGAVNSVRDQSGVDHTSVVAQNLGDSGFSSISYTPAPTSGNGLYAHYTADTSW